MKKIQGLAGSPGKAVLTVAVWQNANFTVEKRFVQDPQAEVARFEAVRKAYIDHMYALYEQTLHTLSEDAAKIFKAYAVIAGDDFFFERPLQTALNEGINPDWALNEEKKQIRARFLQMDNDYMRERASDICNVCDALIRRVNGIPEKALPTSGGPFLLVASNLTPEDTVRMDKRNLGGFVTQKGGITSHTVILAKTLGIPAVVGAADILQHARTGQTACIDGSAGYVLLQPDEESLANFEKERIALHATAALYAQAAAKPAITADGHPVKICINSGDIDSIRTFNAATCDGIGLLRTEFLFMGQHSYPSENDQFGVYRTVAEKTAGKEVIIRTLDISGDKQLHYMHPSPESDPLSGQSSLQLCLSRPDIFVTQLRAILRASAFGHVKMMFPMIVTVEEFLQAKALLQQAKESLWAERTPFNAQIPVGIMVETPAAVLLCDVLAQQADFFSIGTNDLIQYITASDRMNDNIQHRYSPYNLSVLRAIKRVIDTAHAAAIPAGMCGEMASDAKLLPLLLGMGLDTFSVAPTQVGRIKYQLNRMHYAQLQHATDRLSNMHTTEELMAYLDELAPCS